MIGVFDAGLGGLGMVAALAARFPSHDFLFVGDTARLECGNQSDDEIRLQLLQHLRYMRVNGAEAVFVACNSLASYLPDVEATGAVHSVIDAGARAAAKATRNGSVTVLGTRATVQRGKYVEAIDRHVGGLTVHQIACPLFVPLVENDIVTGPVAEAAVRHYVPECPSDTVVLGCTHYPFLAHALRNVLGDSVLLVDPTEALAAEVDDVGPAGRGEMHFVFTNLRPDIVVRVQTMFGDRVTSIREGALC